jgi:predicted nuclease of predicted toxin-antitoxin system
LPRKLIFDENLSARLVRDLADLCPGSIHVGAVDLLGASDLALWEHAQQQDLVIVTKDEDFHRFSTLYGPPPQIIWIRIGNCSTDDVARLLRSQWSEIEDFFADDEAAFLALG